VNKKKEYTMCDDRKKAGALHEVETLAREDLAKTELREIHGGARVGTPDPFGVLAKVAKRVAMETIREEILLYQSIINEAQGDSAKLDLIDRLARLKLGAVGIVIGGMSTVPNEIRRMAPNKILTSEKKTR
jgi:hypothetical protein